MEQELKQKWFCWLPGRQNSGYDKMILVMNKKWLPFDAYIIKYPLGSCVANHRDYNAGYNHFRLNIILRQAEKGGIFRCRRPIITTKWLYFFRSDKVHSVSRITKGSRYVLSAGFLLKRK